MPTAKVSVKVKKEDTKPEVKTLVGSTSGAEADGETSSNVIDLRTQGRDISSSSQSASATNGDMRMNEPAGRDVPTQEVNGILDISIVSLGNPTHEEGSLYFTKGTSIPSIDFSLLLYMPATFALLPKISLIRFI